MLHIFPDLCLGRARENAGYGRREASDRREAFRHFPHRAARFFKSDLAFVRRNKAFPGVRRRTRKYPNFAHGANTAHTTISSAPYSDSADGPSANTENDTDTASAANDARETLYFHKSPATNDAASIAGISAGLSESDAANDTQSASGMNSAHDAQSETANAKTSDSDTPATVSDPNAHESENTIASTNAPRRRRLFFALKIPVYPAHRSGAAAAETIVPAAARYTFPVNRRDSVPSAAAAAVQSAYLTVSLSQKSAEAASPERKSPFSLACCPLPAAPGSLPRFLPRKTSAHRTALTAQAMSAMRTPPFTLRLPRSTPASEAMKNALPSAAQSAAIPNGYVSSTNGAPDVRAEKTNTAAAGAYFTISSGRADVPKCIFRGGVPPCGELCSPAPTETSSNSSSSLRSSIILSFLSSPSRRLHPPMRRGAGAFTLILSSSGAYVSLLYYRGAIFFVEARRKNMELIAVSG